MTELKLNMMMSPDGFVAGPEQSAENPFGIAGMRLNEWLLPLEQTRAVEAPGVTHIRYRLGAK